MTVLPGPSAVQTAIVASGYDGAYLFVGFVPRREEAEPRSGGATRVHALVAFESPRRLPATLRSIAASAPARRVTVCRELTKRFEEVVGGTAEEVAARFAAPPKGEVTLVLEPSPETREGDEAAEALAAVAELVEAGAGRRAAATVVARLTGIARNELYRRTL